MKLVALDNFVAKIVRPSIFQEINPTDFLKMDNQSQRKLASKHGSVEAEVVKNEVINIRRVVRESIVQMSDGFFIISIPWDKIKRK